jgi:nitrogen fixation protein NifX
MLKIAFASNDRHTVNLHFGGAESLLIYDVSPGVADLIAAAEFVKAEELGESGRKGLTGSVQDKVLPKLEFVDGCAAVYAASIGTSSIRRLMTLGVQPIIVDRGHDIVDLLNEVSLALACGGLAWVDRAKARVHREARASSEHAGLVSTGLVTTLATRHSLIRSLDDLE